MAKTHFIVQRADLVRELALISNVVERKTTIPILSNLKIEAADGRITLTGTDLEVALVSSIGNVDVRTPGIATLPAKRLLDYVRLLPEGSVEFKFGENNWANITAGRSKTKIAGMGADAFPEVPKSKPSSMSIPLASLARLIDQTDFAISKEESRFTLKGALLEVGGDSLRMVATDGHRMAVADATGGDWPKLKALIPRRAMVELARLSGIVADTAAAVNFSEDDNHYFLAVGDRTLTARKMTGNFPDYERVMPRESTVTITAVAAELRAAIDRAGVMADERSRAVGLRFAAGEITVSSSVSETGEASEGVAADYSGAPIDIKLNAAYIAEFLGVAGTEKVSIGIKDANSAALFSPVGMESGSYRYIVMPMRG